MVVIKEAIYAEEKKEGNLMLRPLPKFSKNPDDQVLQMFSV